MFHFRAGTNDRFIYEGIYTRNEYKLPTSFAQTDLIIDIGAHIGFFTSLAIERGAGTVYAAEANRENYQIAVHHLEKNIANGRVNLRQSAVWRSDKIVTALYHSGYKYGFDHPHPGIEINTGAGNVFSQTQGEKVPVIPFDTFIQEATRKGARRVRFLKLDCEGSEWPILFTSCLDLIDEIAGEYHEIGGEYDFQNPHLIDLPFKQTVVELEKYLCEHQFNFFYDRATQSNGSPAPRGMFFAKKIP